MKIAIFTDCFLPQMNGVVQSILNNIEYFTKKGHKVVVFAPGKKYAVERLRTFKIIRSFSLPFFGQPEYRMASLAVSRYKEVFEKEKFDIIHCHTQFFMGMTGLLLSREFKVPAVSTYHTLFEGYAHYVDIIPLPEAMSYLRNSTFYAYLREFHKRFYRTVTPTKTMSDYLLEKWGIETAVLSNSIGFEKQKKEEIRKTYSIPRDARIMLFIGRIGPEKNIDLLLDAYKQIPHDKLCLLIAGYGPYLHKLEERVREEQIPNVIFTGKFPSSIKQQLYSACTFFVSVSETETQGMTFIEAMMCGKPVIAARAQGAIDVVKDGEFGYLIRPGDADELASKMKHLLNSPKLLKKFGKAARREAGRYSIDNIGRQMIALYQDAVQHDNPESGARSTFLRFFITRDPRTLRQAFKRLRERLETNVRIV